MNLLTSSEQDLEVFISACSLNNVIKAELALSLGVDINTVSRDGRWSGLTAAAWNGSQKIVKMLLEKPEIDVNIITDGDFNGGSSM